jgi:hypothetical protein
MKDNMTRDMTLIYEKTDKNATERVKTYTEGMKALERQTKRIWSITGVKEALFWSMCVGVVVYTLRATLEEYGVSTPIELWQVLYPSTFVPLIIYVMSEIIKKIKGDE